MSQIRLVTIKPILAYLILLSGRSRNLLQKKYWHSKHHMAVLCGLLLILAIFRNPVLQGTQEGLKCPTGLASGQSEDFMFYFQEDEG